MVPRWPHKPSTTVRVSYLPLTKNKTMAFLRFIVTMYDEESIEKSEILNKEPEGFDQEIRINTTAISSFMPTRDGVGTVIRLNTGDVVTCPLNIDSFEDIISECETIVDLSEVCEN